MEKRCVDSIIKMYDREISLLSLEISKARKRDDIDLMKALCERQDEVLLLFYETIDIINRS